MGPSYFKGMLHSAPIFYGIAFVIALDVIYFSYLRYRKDQRHPYIFAYQQIMDFVPQGRAMLFKIKESSDKIRSIFFSLTDLSQMPALLAELQERMNPSAE